MHHVFFFMEGPVQKKKDSQIRLPKFFDKNPDLKARAIEYLKSIPPEEKQRRLNDYKKFVSGEITWGEISKVSKRMQKELARVAYLSFKMKDYNRAETLFKGLAVVDHTNWYYRAALGAVYQKQNKYEEAIEEYTIALKIKQDEVSCYVNRGECCMLLDDFEAAKKDFEHVLHMKLAKNNPWLIRVKALMQRMALLEKEA